MSAKFPMHLMLDSCFSHAMNNVHYPRLLKILMRQIFCKMVKLNNMLVEPRA
jgi:hypothetical protein